ncbi:MAG: GvpL/GvpF family gas vesicle protein [Bacillota bacterium]
MAYYLYALCHKNAPQPEPSWPGGVASDGRFLYIRTDMIAGLVQEVDLSEFEMGVLKEKLQRPDWLEAKARAHDEVIKHLFTKVDTVVPVRFCTVFRTEEGVRCLLDKQADVILSDLARLHASAEWDIKLYANEKHRLKMALQALGEVSKAGGGIEYLRRKQRQGKLVNEVKEWIRTQASDCYNCLSELSREYRAKPCLACDDDERMALNVVYLVARSIEQKWLEKLQEIARRLNGGGMRMVVSGPWPPYSFVTPVVERDEPNE